MIGVQLYQNLDGTDQALDSTLVKLKNAILNEVVSGGLTLRQVLGVLCAVAVGKTTVNTTGINPIVTFRDVGDTIDSIVATMQGSERVSVTLNNL